MAAEGDESGPGDQIGGGQDDFEPGGVGVEGVTGQVGQAGGFEFADTVRDPTAIFFTCEVPSRQRYRTLEKSDYLLQDRHFRVSTPRNSQNPAKNPG